MCYEFSYKNYLDFTKKSQYSILNTQYTILNTQYSILNTQYSILNTYYVNSISLLYRLHSTADYGNTFRNTIE